MQPPSVAWCAVSLAFRFPPTARRFTPLSNFTLRFCQLLLLTADASSSNSSFGSALYPLSLSPLYLRISLRSALLLSRHFIFRRCPGGSPSARPVSVQGVSKISPVSSASAPQWGTPLRRFLAPPGQYSLLGVSGRSHPGRSSVPRLPATSAPRPRPQVSRP